MNIPEEIPGEHWEDDLLYLKEIQLAKEEHHNEVTGTIDNKGNSFNQKAGASLSRRQIQQTEHSQESSDSPTDGHS